jgi:hypothetical protein
MSLTTPSKLRELQIKLYRKAKNEASTGAIARHQPLQSKWYSANWGKCSSAESGSNLVRESAVKPVGKPDALIGHVRFDERGWETGRRSGVSTRAHPRLYKVRRGGALSGGQFPISPHIGQMVAPGELNTGPDCRVFTRLAKGLRSVKNHLAVLHLITES